MSKKKRNNLGVAIAGATLVAAAGAASVALSNKKIRTNIKSKVSQLKNKAEKLASKLGAKPKRKRTTRKKR